MKNRKFKGSALIVAVMIAVVFGILISGLIFLVRANSSEVFSRIEEDRLFYEAEAQAKMMLKRLSVPANYDQSTYFYDKTVNGMASDVKVKIEAKRTGTNFFIITSTATRGKRSVVITITPKADPVLKSPLVSLAKFGGVFRPGFLVFGDVEMTGKIRITLGKDKDGKIIGPEFFGVVHVNMNNPYKWTGGTDTDQDEWHKEFNNKYYSSFEQAGSWSYRLPNEVVGSCDFSNISGNAFVKGLLIAENIENGGGKATGLSTKKMRAALMNVFKGDKELSKSFDSDAPALDPSMVIQSYSELTAAASKDLTSTTSNKILPFVAGVQPGKNSRQNVKIEFVNGQALIKVMKDDGVTPSTETDTTPLIISQANTKVLVIPKEYGDVYVKGKISSDFTLVTEKDNIIIEGDLYTTGYENYVNKDINPDTYESENGNHDIDKIKDVGQNETIPNLALIPAHNDTTYTKKFKQPVAYNGRNTTYGTSFNDSFTNEAFYTSTLNDENVAYLGYMPTQGTVKIVKNNDVDNGSKNPLLVTAAIYSKHSAMTTFAGEEAYKELSNRPGEYPADGQYSKVEAEWHKYHDADKAFSNFNNLIFVGSYLGYDFPNVYRPDVNAQKGLRPLYMSSANFRKGMLPPGFTPNSGSNSSATLNKDPQGLIAFRNLQWSVKR